MTSDGIIYDSPRSAIISLHSIETRDTFSEESQVENVNKRLADLSLEPDPNSRRNHSPRIGNSGRNRASLPLSAAGPSNTPGSTSSSPKHVARHSVGANRPGSSLSVLQAAGRRWAQSDPGHMVAQSRSQTMAGPFSNHDTVPFSHFRSETLPNETSHSTQMSPRALRGVHNHPIENPNNAMSLQQWNGFAEHDVSLDTDRYRPESSRHNSIDGNPMDALRGSHPLLDLDGLDVSTVIERQKDERLYAATLAGLVDELLSMRFLQ